MSHAFGARDERAPYPSLTNVQTTLDDYAEKLDPHPQLLVELGLMKLKP
jgi:hypothetical protein